MSDDLRSNSHIVNRLRNMSNVFYEMSWHVLYDSENLLDTAADRIEELEKENFMLAARQCLFSDGEGLTGSPSGHAYCAKDEEIERGWDKYVETLVKIIEEAEFKGRSDEYVETLIKILEEAGYTYEDLRQNMVSLDVECDNLTLELKRTNAKLEKAVESLEKLARLGNGDHPYRHGNIVARSTLAELKGDKQ